MNKIVLIGGAPTVGKSFIARKISEELKLPWISTDIIRGMMRPIVSRNKYPELFQIDENEVTAENYLTSHSLQEIVDDQNKESEEVWKGVNALIGSDYVWKNFIVEGVAVIPKLVEKLDKTKHDIKPIFLVDENEGRVRDVVYTRGLWDDARTYSDSVKEIEVQWVALFNKYIQSEASKYGYQVYKIDGREEFTKNLTQELRDWLK